MEFAFERVLCGHVMQSPGENINQKIKTGERISAFGEASQSQVSLRLS